MSDEPTYYDVLVERKARVDEMFIEYSDDIRLIGNHGVLANLAVIGARFDTLIAKEKRYLHSEEAKKLKRPMR